MRRLKKDSRRVRFLHSSVAPPVIATLAEAMRWIERRGRPLKSAVRARSKAVIP